MVRPHGVSDVCKRSDQVNFPYFNACCNFKILIVAERCKLNLLLTISKMYLDIFKHMRVTDNARCQKKSI